MELATSIGISITEFWDITPFELQIAQKGYIKAKERDFEEYNIKFKNQQDLAVYQAYLTSRWVWQKRVDYKKYLNNKVKNKTMTDDELYKQGLNLVRMFGGEVKASGKE